MGEETPRTSEPRPALPRDGDLVRAIEDNTEAIHQLRVALCGATRDPVPGGAIGRLGDELTRARGGW